MNNDKFGLHSNNKFGLERDANDIFFRTEYKRVTKESIPACRGFDRGKEFTEGCRDLHRRRMHESQLSKAEGFAGGAQGLATVAESCCVKVIDAVMSLERNNEVI